MIGDITTSSSAIVGFVSASKMCNLIPIRKTNCLHVARMYDSILSQPITVSPFLVASLTVKKNPGNPPMSDQERIDPVRKIPCNLENLTSDPNVLTTLWVPSGTFPKRYLNPFLVVKHIRGLVVSSVKCVIVVTLNISVPFATGLFGVLGLLSWVLQVCRWYFPECIKLVENKERLEKGKVF